MIFYGCAGLIIKQSHAGNLVYPLTVVVSAVTDASRKSYNDSQAALMDGRRMDRHSLTSANCQLQFFVSKNERPGKPPGNLTIFHRVFAALSFICREAPPPDFISFFQMFSETFDTGCQEDAAPDTHHLTIVFPGNRDVQVRNRLFLELSDAYARAPASPAVSNLNLSDDTIHSVKAWFEGEGECEVNEDNFDELLLFANEWEIQGLLRQCEQFADQYFSVDQEPSVLAERVLTVLQHRVELNEPTADLEDLLSERLHLFASEIVANEELQRLVKSIGFPVFWRVCERHKDELVGKHINELLQFLCHCETELEFPEFLPYVVTERNIGSVSRQNMSELRRVPSMASLCFDMCDRHLLKTWYIQAFLVALLIASLCFVSYLFMGIRDDKTRTEILDYETQQKSAIIDGLQASLTESMNRVETLDNETQQKSAIIDGLQASLTESMNRVETLDNETQQKSAIIDGLETSLTESMKKVETLDDEMSQKNKTIDDLQTRVKQSANQIGRLQGELQASARRSGRRKKRWIKLLAAAAAVSLV